MTEDRISHFNIQSFDDAVYVCEELVKNPSARIPLSIYNYNFNLREIIAIYQKFPQFKWLKFLAATRFPEKWKRYIEGKGILNITLCRWFKIKGFFHECIIETAVRYKLVECYEFCIEFGFNVSFKAFDLFCEDPSEINIEKLMVILAKNYNQDMCELICSYPEEYFVDVILEKDLPEMFIKFILMFEKFYMKCIVNSFFNSIVESIHTKYTECELSLTTANRPNRNILFFLISTLKSKKFVGVDSETARRYKNHEPLNRDVPIENKIWILESVFEENTDPIPFEEFLYTEGARKIIVDFMVTSFKSYIVSTVMVDLLKMCASKGARKCFNAYMKLQEFIFPSFVTDLLKSLLEMPNFDFFNDAAKHMTKIKGMDITNYIDAKELVSKCISTNNINLVIVSRIFYPGILDDAVSTDNIEMIDVIIGKYPNVVCDFKSVKSIEVLEHLRTKGKMILFSYEPKPNSVYFYDGIRLDFVAWIMDNFAFDLKNLHKKYLRKMAAVGFKAYGIKFRASSIYLMLILVKRHQLTTYENLKRCDEDRLFYHRAALLAKAMCGTKYNRYEAMMLTVKNVLDEPDECEKLKNIFKPIFAQRGYIWNDDNTISGIFPESTHPSSST